MLKIGIIGCGAIGSSLAKAIAKDFRGRAKVSALYDLDGGKSVKLSRVISKSKGLSVNSLGQLIKKSDLVIEASSAKSSFEIAKAALNKSRDIMIMSVGGVTIGIKDLSALAKKHKAKIYIPSGAISGVDALKAAAVNKIDKVILTTRKNPLSFKGVEYVQKKKVALEKIKKDTVLFSGSAKRAMRFFPQNINVAGVLSIAGLGADKTIVRIVASPKTKKNIHEIQIQSQSADIFTCTENVLHPDNPKTSYLAVLSAVATLKQILEPVRVGT